MIYLGEIPKKNMSPSERRQSGEGGISINLSLLPFKFSNSYRLLVEQFYAISASIKWEVENKNVL